MPVSDLDQLREQFGSRYTIRKVGGLWVATDRDPYTGTEPTLTADSLDALADQMRHPGPRLGGPFPNRTFGK
ncbi:hypothetical protein [Nocardiopsis sp. LOL_012]|uniref:hypothetical protein n=1 Tax=Nocardiopsis sp. LOL_012 TaxID=3345409 RepID=UPI003A890E2E